MIGQCGLLDRSAADRPKTASILHLVIVEDDLFDILPPLSHEPHVNLLCPPDKKLMKAQFQATSVFVFLAPDKQSNLYDSLFGMITFLLHLGEYNKYKGECII